MPAVRPRGASPGHQGRGPRRGHRLSSNNGGEWRRVPCCRSPRGVALDHPGSPLRGESARQPRPGAWGRTNPHDPDNATSVRAVIRAPHCRTKPRLASGWRHEGAIGFGLAPRRHPRTGPPRRPINPLDPLDPVNATSVRAVIRGGRCRAKPVGFGLVARTQDRPAARPVRSSGPGIGSGRFSGGLPTGSKPGAADLAPFFSKSGRSPKEATSSERCHPLIGMATSDDAPGNTATGLPKTKPLF
jgi:hypothetical protein